ncbi:Monooxygenase [Macleaya cordata]|uniref:Monooxygenase n=1 Tax=Macleaya cordata TaxID=56857 RepID=A0A200PYS7_MACCD|nr:Monooxygenase [Macleaya cordata]
MEIMMKEEVVIVGGGVAGLATALALKKVGVRALVLERSNELRVKGAALTLFSNAWLALEALGVAHKLTSIYAPYKGDAWLATGPRAVHRRALLESLIEELPTDTIRYSSKLHSIETTTHKHHEAASSDVILHLEDGTSIQTKVLIGCDGVHSVVARWLGLKDVVHSGRYAVRGLGVFPEGHGLKHEVQQFVDKGRRFGIAPLTDKEVYWFMAYQPLPNKDDEMASGDPKLIQKSVLESVADFPPVVLDVIQHSDTSSLTWAPLMFRYPWDLIFGHLSKGTITVAGDAMHPMTPDLGQGGCTALEDAVVLGRRIGNSFIRNRKMMSQEDLEREIEMYVKERRWRSAGLITASYLAGWVQQGGGGGSSGVGWLMKFLRDSIFYKSIYRRIGGLVHYDCGKLPTVSTVPSEFEHDGHNKSD